jgi:hypothetical protein
MDKTVLVVTHPGFAKVSGYEIEKYGNYEVYSYRLEKAMKSGDSVIFSKKSDMDKIPFSLPRNTDLVYDQLNDNYTRFIRRHLEYFVPGYKPQVLISRLKEMGATNLQVGGEMLYYYFDPCFINYGSVLRVYDSLIPEFERVELARELCYPSVDPPIVDQLKNRHDESTLMQSWFEKHGIDSNIFALEGENGLRRTLLKLIKTENLGTRK